MKNFKFKALCDIYGKDFVWNSGMFYGWFITIHGWFYYVVGNVYHILKGATFGEILEFNKFTMVICMWTCSFLLAIHIYKKKLKN